MLVRLFLAGVALMAATMTVIALSNAAGFSFPGLALLLEFLIFMGLFPTLMGLFVSVTPEQTGRRVAEREIRQSYYPRR